MYIHSPSPAILKNKDIPTALPWSPYGAKTQEKHLGDLPPTVPDLPPQPHIT